MRTTETQMEKLEIKERTRVERELNELIEATFRMEHELELLFKETELEN